MKKIIQLIACITLPLLVGATAGISTASNIKGWFTTLQKPSFNPPNYLFGPVWTLLYLLMGVSLYLILNTPKSPQRTTALWIFGVQFTLNFAWTFLFFQFHLLGIALIEIVLMWLAIVAMIRAFYPLHATAAWLQVPYLLWVSFATALNAAFWWLN